MGDFSPSDFQFLSWIFWSSAVIGLTGGVILGAISQMKKSG